MYRSLLHMPQVGAKQGKECKSVPDGRHRLLQECQKSDSHLAQGSVLMLDACVCVCKGELNWVSARRRDPLYTRHKSPAISSALDPFFPPSSRSLPHHSHDITLTPTLFLSRPVTKSSHHHDGGHATAQSRPCKYVIRLSNFDTSRLVPAASPLPIPPHPPLNVPTFCDASISGPSTPQVARTRVNDFHLIASTPSGPYSLGLSLLPLNAPATDHTSPPPGRSPQWGSSRYSATTVA